jgi:proteasome assembly chaperone (PAC2) family protein
LGVQIKKYPNLDKAILVACWPGMGNIGSIAGDYLVKQLGAEEFAEIESWDYFYPRKVSIKSGVLQYLEFPTNKFYFKKLEKRDVIIFVGEEEPDYDNGAYSQGKKALRIGNLILDVAEQFGCHRIYTCCAAISSTHHASASGVWAAVSHEYLKKEIKEYPQTVLKSYVEGQGRFSTIPGLKGLLAGMAGARGMESVCLMGEVPDYLTRVHLPYPKASKAVLQVVSYLLGVDLDFNSIDEMVGQIDKLTDKIMDDFPREIKDRIEQRRSELQSKPPTITQEDETWIKQHIDELFKKGGSSGG